jgi:hypothetical protein
MKWKLARLSVAMAYLPLSSNDDFSAVQVTKEHVKEVVKFLTAEYSAAELNVLAQKDKFEKMTVDDVSVLLLSIQGQLARARVIMENTFCMVIRFHFLFFKKRRHKF